MQNSKIDIQLDELGLQPEDAEALFLAPMALVAWADGKADMTELETLASKHSVRNCPENVLCISERARKFIYYNFVYTRPRKELEEKVINLLKEIMDGSSAERNNQMRDMITGMCLAVAKSSGSGLLGFIKKLDKREKEAMRQLVEKLRLQEGAKASQMLKEAGIL